MPTRTMTTAVSTIAVVLFSVAGPPAHAAIDGRAKCKEAKSKAAGKEAFDFLKAYGKNGKKRNDAKLSADISKAKSKFAKAFAKAESKGECATTGDAADVEAEVTAFILEAIDEICPPAVSGETFDIPSPAEPAKTPGSPGVVVTNPNLITQFGGSDFSLNNARYTRWRLRGPEQAPDAILILVAGFGGGANNFKIMAEDLIERVLADHGLVIEVWGFHRRTNQLEDREGIAIATELRDPLIALDWYYGDDLGLSLHPALAAGPNRRAFFYNTSDDIPFIANFTGQVHSRDINAVVDVARALARNGNVFLGGHSAGTGFTARYAATDFNFTGVGDPDPGYAKLRGLVLLEGEGGRTGSPLSEDSLDRIEDKFDGGLFAAVRDNAPRCVDGTACTVLTEGVDCAGKGNGKCTPPTTAYAAILGLSPQVTAASEPAALQRLADPDRGQVILQVPQPSGACDIGGTGLCQGGPDDGEPCIGNEDCWEKNTAIKQVPELLLLSILPPSTVDGMLAAYLDDDGLAASFSPSIATSLGAPGPVVDGLQTWLGIADGSPMPPSVLPDNGPQPTSLPAGHWGQEREVVRIGRYAAQFLATGHNAADWYYSSAGLYMTSVPGVCDSGTCDVGGTDLCQGGAHDAEPCAGDEDCGECTVGDVGAACASDDECGQSIGLDSTQLSVGRGRRDIINQTQAASINIPVICFGGSNGNTSVPADYLGFAESIGTCTAPSCDGLTPRIVDELVPNPAFPSFGNEAGGFEVHITEGIAHQDVTAAEDDENNNVISPLSNFIARNSL